MGRSRCRGKVDRDGGASHVGAAGGIYGNAVGEVTAAAAEVGGGDEGGAGRIKLGREGDEAAGEGRLEGRRRRREGAGTGAARHVGIAGGLHSYAEAPVLAG